MEIFRILFDRRHVKDVRIWVLMIIAIVFGFYHKFTIIPIQERQERQGKKIRQIIFAAHLQGKLGADPATPKPEQEPG